MNRSIVARPGLGAALQIVQEGGRPLRRVLVEVPCVILVLAGVKRVRAGSRRVAAQAGEVVALAAVQEIEVTNVPPATGPYEAHCLAFDPALFEIEVAPDAARIDGALALPTPPAHFRAALQRALAACDPDAGPPEPLARHHLQEVLVSLSVLGGRFDTRALHSHAARVRRLLNADPAQAWRAEAVARTLGLSEATLRRRLERERTSFRALLLQVRMSRALGLLQASDLPIVQIAYACGYESVSQFTARFRAHFGQTPATLRGRAGN
jgi:AraC-like DNA-binding protein